MDMTLSTRSGDSHEDPICNSSNRVGNTRVQQHVCLGHAAVSYHASARANYETGTGKNPAAGKGQTQYPVCSQGERKS